MNNTKIAATILVTLAFFSVEANAKGCLTGAAVGGTAGHFAGHHSVIGAGIGCMVGRHRANKKDKEAAAMANQTSPAPVQQTTTPVRTVPTK
jgi:hypothetical protein